MENKKVGGLIIGIAIAVTFIVLLFSISMNNLAEDACTHGDQCTMHETVSYQLGLSLAIVAIIIAIGLYIMFSKPEEKTIIQKVKTKARKKKIDTSGLNKNEKKVVELLLKEKAIFQAELKEKLEIGKVGLTRLLDKLEAKQIIERKRRGMNNVVVLKE